MTLSEIYVVEDQEHRARRKGESLVQALARENVPVMTALHQAIDILWVCNESLVMWDLKTPADFTASCHDGRAFEQLTFMRDSGSKLFGFLIEGDQWSFDGGLMVGDGDHVTDWGSFVNSLLRVQMWGAKIAFSSSQSRTATTLASIYRWSAGMDEPGSFANPVPIYPANDFKGNGPIFIDRTFRSQVGMIMHLPGAGAKTANSMREKYPLMDILGITEDGLAKAQQLWAATPRVGPKLVDKWGEYLHSS